MRPAGSTAPATGYKIPAKVKRAFIRGCASVKGASRAECRCAIKKLERAYTWS